MKTGYDFRYRLFAAAAGISVAAQPAFARSIALPGSTLGLPIGWQLPVGLYFNMTSSFSERGTLPRDSQGNNNTALLLWATPWTVAGAQLRFHYTHPIIATSPQATPWQAGFGQPLIGAQLAWKIGDGLGFSYLLGGYMPNQTRFLVEAPSLSQRFAISYVRNDWNLTANLHYGTMLENRNAAGVFYSDYMNLDLTAAKRLGKWLVGAVAFGSTDLPTGRRGYRHLGQFAMGGIVGYNFGRISVHTMLTRDVAQRNYGGEETRAWVRLLVPIYRAEEEAVPNRVLVRSNRAAN